MPTTNATIMPITEPFEPPNTLTICVDLKDPYSHLAIPRTVAMLERTAHRARWLPFNRHPMASPVAVTEQEDRSAQHRRQRDEYRERELHHYAEALNLPLARLYENPATDTFASALMWLQTEHDAPQATADFLQRCFADYWSGAMTTVSVPAVAALLERLGLAHERWLGESTRAHQLSAAASKAVTGQYAALRSAGLFNSPAYLYQGEVYYGRAHLPLLEALLGSECGL